VKLTWPHSILLALASLAFGHSTSPPSYVSRIWRTQDGLPENRIRAIAQTPDGYLWIGTAGGLARFDGVRFVVFARFNTPAMTGDDVSALAVARDGSLWAATDGGGLLHYQDGRFRSFGPKEGLANEFVRAVLEDRKGDVWAATNRGLFHRVGERFERVDEALHLPNIAFFGLYETRDGRVFAGGPSGLFLIQGGKLHPHGPRPEPEETIYRIGETRDGSLWLGTTRGLKISARSNQDLKSIYTTSMVTALSEDMEGNIRFGTMGQGLFLIPSGRQSAVPSSVRLPDNSVSAIFEDRERNIWVGTADGLVRMSAPDVGVLSSRDGLSDDNVTSVYTDSRGVV